LVKMVEHAMSPRIADAHTIGVRLPLEAKQREQRLAIPQATWVTRTRLYLMN